MKNLKKFFAVVLAVAMLATLMSVPAMADTDYTDEAGYLEAMNLLRGTDGDLKLDEAPDRLQALVMLLYLTGEAETAAEYMTDEAAAEYLTEQGFTDVDDVVWGASILAYCVDEGYLYGGSGLLDAHGECTAEMFAAYMMRVIVDADDLPAWDGTSANLSALLDKGAMSNSDFATFLMAGEFTRELAAGMMYGTLSATIEKENGNGKTVAQNLFDNGVIDADQAAAGNVSVAEPTPTPAPELEVEGITITNLKEFTITFNQAVDEDSFDEADITINDSDADEVSVSDDGLVVTVTVADADVIANDNSEDYEVEVSTDVTDADGNALAEAYTETVSFMDATKPYVDSFELVGPNEIELTFNEPVKTVGTVRIVKGNSRYSTTPTADGNVVTLAFTASLSEQDYTLEVRDFKDYADIAMDDDDLTLSYVENTDAITATIDSAEQNEVVIVFNKKVTLDDTDAYVDYFYHTFTTWEPDTVTSDGGTSSDTEWTLEFTTHPIPEGTYNLTINYDGANEEPITDLWDVEMDANIVLSVTVTADTTAPEVVGDIEVEDQEAFVITFNEGLDQTSAEDEDNYTVLDSDGEEVDTAFTAAYDDDDKTVTLTFAAILDAGTYTVDIADVEDDALEGNVIDDVTLTAVVTDEQPVADGDITVTYANDAAEGLDYIYVNYGSVMATTGEYSVLDADNYLIDVDGAGVTESAIALDDDAELEIFGVAEETVKITIPEAVVDGTTVLTIGRVADEAGNKTVELSIDKTINEAAAPTVTAIEQTDSDTFVVEFDAVLDSITDDSFTVTVGGDVYAIDSISTELADNTDEDATVTYATVVFDSDLLDALAAIEADYGTDTGMLLSDVAGAALNFVVGEAEDEKGMTNDASVETGTVTDVWVPSYDADVDVDYTNTTNSTIEITFSEDLNTTGDIDALYAHDLIVKDGDGDALTPGTDYSTQVAGKVLTITITGVANIDEYTVDSVDEIVYIQDDAENICEAFDGIEKP